MIRELIEANLDGVISQMVGVVFQAQLQDEWPRNRAYRRRNTAAAGR